MAVHDRDDDNTEYTMRLDPIATPQGFHLPLETEAHLMMFNSWVDKMSGAQAKETLKLCYKNFTILRKLVAYWAKYGW